MYLYIYCLFMIADILWYHWWTWCGTPVYFRLQISFDITGEPGVVYLYIYDCIYPFLCMTSEVHLYNYDCSYSLAHLVSLVNLMRCTCIFMVADILWNHWGPWFGTPVYLWLQLLFGISGEPVVVHLYCYGCRYPLLSLAWWICACREYNIPRDSCLRSLFTVQTILLVW